MSYPTVTFPFGMLHTFVSVGGDTYGFSPAVGPTSPVYNVDEELLDEMVSLPDQPYPVDMQGVGAAPWKPMTASWDFLLVAAEATTHAAAYQAVEADYAALRSFLRGDAGGGTGGTRGTLACYRADQTTLLSCTARLLKMSLSLVSGKNTRYYIVPLTFQLLSDWA